MARPVLLWVRLGLLLALLVGTFGMVLNDEQDQATAFHNLAQGSLETQEHPREFYHLRGDLHRQMRFQGTEPVGSTLLDYLAYPVLLLLRALDWMVPLGVWAAALAAGLTYSFLPARWRSPWLFLVLVPAFASGFRFAQADMGLFGPIVALQATDLALFAACVAFLGMAIQRHVAWPAAHVAMATLVLGPLVFWATRMKYSMLSALLASMALWLAGEPASTRRDVALGLVAALAIWANIGEGAVLLAAGGVWLLLQAWDRRRSRRADPDGPSPSTRPSTLGMFGAVALGLAIGLVPWAMENEVLRGHPLRASYLGPPNAAGEPSIGYGEAAGTGLPTLIELAFAGEIWAGPVDFLLNLAGPWTTGWRAEGDPVGVFVLAPLLALALWTGVRRAAWRRPDLALAALLVLWHVAMLTNRVVRQGWGLDARLLVPLLPAVGLLAAPAIGAILGRHGPHAPRAALRLGVLWGIAGALFLLAAGFGLPQGLKHWSVDRILVLVWAALGAAVAALYAIGRGSGILRFQTPAPVVAVGLAVAMPIVWTALVGMVVATSIPADDGLRASAFVPVMDDVRGALGPHLFPPSRLPVVTDEFGRVVFHPDHGYCDADPSPCPWWTGPIGSEPPATPATGNATAA